jgi:DNA replication licensing factor MCM5
LDPFSILADSCSFVDTQSLKLQESPENVPTGEMPRTLQLHVARYLVNRVKPGSRCRVVGVMSIVDGASNAAKRSGPQAASIRTAYLRCVGLEVEADGAAGVRQTFTAEDEERMKEIARDEHIYTRLSTSIIAPEIWGRDDIKKAVACQLFSGVRQSLPDGLKLRGDIHILLLGDPSVAKSQFLKFAEKCSPVAVYTSGKGSSAAGLTASVIRDVTTGEFHLEGGALVLADGGIVCIDEFDKMRPQDRVAIHEAMEQQTISIAKAGITTTLNSRAGVLAAANPAFGRYDDMKTPEENIDFQSTILSRFDMIFVIQDKRDPEQDRAVTQHVLKMYQIGAGTTQSRDSFNDELFRDMPTLKRYVGYARLRCQPCLSQEAHQVLVNYYVNVRESMRKQAEESGASVIPITVRQLEAIIRISESLARMQLQQVATVDHVNEAIRLFQVSTLHAAQTGVVSGEGLAGSAFGEQIKKAEARIRRRLAIGSFVPVAKLIADLKTQGEDEVACRKAIEIMERAKEVELTAQRRMIRRTA